MDGTDGQIRDDQEKEDEECAKAHRPAEAYIADEMGHHHRKDNPSNIRAREQDSKGCTTLVIEPPGGAGNGCKD